MKAIEKDQLIKLYDKQAGQYEKLRRRKRSFDHAWRKQLLRSAAGRILEVSVGAGANFKFYPPDAEVIAVDISPAMIIKAREAALDAGIKATFMVSAVENLNFEQGSFDTIVSTLSLCAYEDPVHTLKLFGRCCKKDGMILLLEHGVSKYGFVHWLQNRIDYFQYNRIGCHANRDILDIVRRSELQIIKVERKLMGVMYLVWLKPS